MEVSRSRFNAKHFKPIEVKGLEDVAKIASTQPQQNWSCGIFKDNYRDLQNFERAYFIGLDVDEGMTLKEATEAFKDYAHCIVTSRSHQKEKHGKVADRFRVVLKLEKPIDSAEHFYSTWHKLQEKFPAIDPACKDPSRMWYTGKNIVSVKEQGDLVEVCTEKVERPEAEVIEIDENNLGRLSMLTNNFLEFGAKPGEWNRRLFRAAKDMQEQGYSYDLAVLKLRRATLNFEGELDENDLQTITSAFKNAPKYNQRSGPFKWESVDELSDSTEIDWLVSDLIAQGGMGLIAGKAGLGKSTITRQLAYCVCTGTPFLGRKTTKGAVLHITLEEGREILKKEASTQGLQEVDNYFLHTRNVNIIKHIEELEKDLVEKGAKLLIIDSLIRAAGGLDLNNQRDTNAFLTPLQDLAERADVSILLVHHQNKGGSGQDSVAGSFAIAAAGDMVMTFEGEGKRRYLNTTKLRGGTPFHNFQIEYNAQRRWYEPTGYTSRKQKKEDLEF